MADVPKFSETRLRPGVKLAAQCFGSLFCCLGILVGFVYLVDGYSVSTNNSDAPSWSETWVWMSTAHHLDVWGDAAFPPPPPPNF
ncbi:MAG: hypothetical protein CMI16_14120 [Opitutaceae bacterium]|nr:hypothetical protein [Opitutaceae bacterium]